MTIRKKVALASVAICVLGILVCSILALAHFRRDWALADLAHRYENEWHEHNTILADMVVFGEAAVPHLEALARRTQRQAPMDWLTAVPGTAAEEAYARLVPWHLEDVAERSRIEDWETVPGLDAYTGSLGEMTRRNPRIWESLLASVAVDGFVPEDHVLVDIAIEQLALLPPTPTRRELLLRWAKATRGKAIPSIWRMTGDCELAATFLEADWVPFVAVPAHDSGPPEDTKIDLAGSILGTGDGKPTVERVFERDLEAQGIRPAASAGAASGIILTPEEGTYVSWWYDEMLREARRGSPDRYLRQLAEWLRDRQKLFTTSRQRDEGGEEYGPPEVVFLPSQKDEAEGRYPEQATP